MSDFWDNYGLQVCFILFFGSIIIGLLGIPVAGSISIANQTDAIDQTKHDLELQGFTVVKGEINSPTVIELTNNYQFFAETSKGQKIYQYNQHFISVFNSTYGLSYSPEYEAPFWYIWGSD